MMVALRTILVVASLPSWTTAFQPPTTANSRFSPWRLVEVSGTLKLKQQRYLQHSKLQHSKLRLQVKKLGDDRPFQPTTNRPRNSPCKSELLPQILELGSCRDCRGILRLYSHSRNEFNIVDFATAMSQIAKSRPPRHQYELLDGLVDHMADYIYKTPLDTRAYSNIVHSITKLDLRTVASNRIIARLQDEGFATEFLRRCNSIDMANIAWSLAKRKSTEEFGIVMDNASHTNIAALFHAKSPQNAVTVAWGCGTMGYYRSDLFYLVEQNAVWLVNDGSPQDVSNAAMACAKIGYRAPNMFAAIESCGEGLVANGNAQDVSNTAWAFATLGHEASKLFAAIDDRSQWLVSNGSTQNVANTAWAFATLGYKDPKLFADIEHRSQWLVANGTTQEVANTAWAFAKLGHSAPVLFELISKNIHLLAVGREETYFRRVFELAEESLGVPNPFKVHS